MTGFLLRKPLDRRHFLKGMGCSLALPWLESMMPPLSDTPPVAPHRHLFVFFPNGAQMGAWIPKSKGALRSLPKTLKPLTPFLDQLTVTSGLALDGGRAHGDGPGDHARAVASFLTAAHPKKTGGTDIHCGVSVDQVLAAELGQETLFRSLELGIERGRSSGRCDSGYSCAYSNNIAWRSATQPVTKETNPREVFARLFGDPHSARDRAREDARRRRRQSLLDFAADDLKGLRSKLGRRDREKIDQYAEAIREVERRLSRSDAPKKKGFIPPADLLERKGRGAASRAALMYDLIALAFEADLTRVVTFMLGNAGSNRSYPDLDIRRGHHKISHHGGNVEARKKLQRIEEFNVNQFAAFLQTLESKKVDRKSLLDCSTILYGSSLSDGNRHRHENLPILLAGKGAGTLKGGRHHVSKKERPAADLYLALLKKAGLKANSFADSHSALEGL